MDMQTYFSLPEFQAHPEAEFYRRVLGEGHIPAPGEIREGMLVFTAETACCWGGPYPCDTAHFMLTDVREAKFKYLGIPLVDARVRALARVSDWLDPIRRDKPRSDTKAHYLQMLAKVEADDPDTIHQVLAQGTQEYPIRLWVTGNDDCSYSKWFATVEEAEALLSLLEFSGPLDYSKDFLTFVWAFMN